MSRYFISAACGWITSLSYKLLFNLLHTAAKWQQGCVSPMCSLSFFPFEVFFSTAAEVFPFWSALFSPSGCTVPTAFLIVKLEFLSPNTGKNQQLAGFTCCHPQPGNSRDIRDTLTRLRKNKLGVFLLWLMCLSKDENAIITPTGYCGSFRHRCRSSMSLSNVWIEQKRGGMEDVSTGDPSWQPDTQILLAYF